MAVKLGAVGFEGIKKWDHAGKTRIAQIVVSYSTDHLYTLQFTYFNDDGASVTTDVIGSPNYPGDTHKVITFEGGNEYIEKVEGDYKFINGHGIVLRKLSIVTDVQEYSVVLFEQNVMGWYKKFVFDFGESKQFGGFYGSQTADGVITSIGVYLNSFQLLPSVVGGGGGDEDDDKDDSAGDSTLSV